MRELKIKEQSSDLQPAKARIIARLIGDGCIYRSKYTIKYEVQDKESLSSFSHDVKDVYGLDIKYGSNLSGITGRPIPFVRLRSKKVYDDLMQYGPYDSYNWRISNIVFKANKDVKKEFLKALFDDEGTVHPSKKIVKFYSVNLFGVMQVQSILQEFGIDSKIYAGYGCKRNVYGLVIVGETNLRKFANEIGFGLERKMIKLSKIVNKAALNV